MLYLKLITMLSFRAMNSDYNEGENCYHVNKGGLNMDNNIEKALWKDYNELGDLINVMSNDDERKRGLLEERDKIRNELLKLEQNKNDIMIKREEINAEDEREKIRNRITIATFGISTAISLYAIAKTFKFDQDSTVTSTLGRNILNGVIPKLFKK